MKKVIPGKSLMEAFVLAFLLSLALLTPFKVEADMYESEEPSRQLIVDKRIKTTSVENWQDNLPASQIVLKNSDIVEFEIVVKNTGDETLNNIDVWDNLPSYLKFIFGPANPQENGKDINWKIDRLNPGEERAFQIRTQIEGADTASSNGNFCLMNKVSARADTGEYDEDTASFCLVGAEKLPTAGAGNLVIGTIVASTIALLGIGLRKFGRGEILG